MIKTTEQSSLYNHLEQKSSLELLQIINQEDQKVALAVEKQLHKIAPLIDVIVEKMKKGGRLFYIGAGTSGRLGILDASECPPTYGVPNDWVIGIIAGGDKAIKSSVESAEDDVNQAWKDLSEYHIHTNDVVVGIAASGTTPYVVHGLKKCQEEGVVTGSISCNLEAPMSQYADFPIEVVVGPEVVTGSTRMKSGTAQKLILNMISTSVMIGMGRVVDNKMVDMQLSNNKLVDRGIQMVQNQLDISYEEASELLSQHGSVRKAVASVKQK